MARQALSRLQCAGSHTTQLQVATYSAARGAHYSRHYDNNPWELANRREITILLYLNSGWDAQRNGGCLRLHHESDGAKGQRNYTEEDIEPCSGRIVLFKSATQAHSVLPCIVGERLALTLWLEYAE